MLKLRKVSQRLRSGEQVRQSREGVWLTNGHWLIASNRLRVLPEIEGFRARATPKNVMGPIAGPLQLLALTGRHTSDMRQYEAVADDCALQLWLSTDYARWFEKCAFYGHGELEPVVLVDPGKTPIAELPERVPVSAIDEPTLVGVLMPCRK